MPSKLRLESNKWLKDILHNKHYNIALNLGCGNDNDKEGEFYSNYFNSNTCLLIDNLSEEKFQNQFSGKLDYIASADNLPIDDNSIDFLFMNWVIYKCNVKDTFNEINRVLKKGGDAMISYSSATPDFIFIKNVLGEMFNIKSRFHMDVVEKGYIAKAIFGVKL